MSQESTPMSDSDDSDDDDNNGKGARKKLPSASEKFFADL